MMESINEKLTTGYHGVRHLFKRQNPHKPGVLNKYVVISPRFLFVGQMKIIKGFLFFKYFLIY